MLQQALVWVFASAEGFANSLFKSISYTSAFKNFYSISPTIDPKKPSEELNSNIQPSQLSLQTKSVDVDNPEITKIDWRPYRNDLEINEDLFQRGVIVVRTMMLRSKEEGKEEPASDGTFFTFSSRKLVFSKTLKSDNKKTALLLKNLEQFCGNKTIFNENKNSFIFNESRREEIFLPFVVDNAGKNIGLYLYPWLSMNKKEFVFDGFNKFYTTGCIFGSALKAVDQNGAVFELIKHDIKFCPSQKIVNIEINPNAFGAYETTSFSELEKLAILMKKLSKKDKPIQLCYHLPYLDYMLFGVELFLKGRITIPALDIFLKSVFTRKTKHIEEIEKIFKAHNIGVEIESPFQNLFGKDFCEKVPDAKSILTAWNIGCEESEPELNTVLQTDKESKFVAYCLNRLTTNTEYEVHRQIWDDFVGGNQQTITNLEEIFKIANAVMIALASKGEENYKTCALTTLSEKQIQVNYSTFNKKMPEKYPAVFNLTVLDPVISYDNTNKGLLFYFRNSQESLIKLIQKRKILDLAHENVSHFLENKDPIHLKFALEKN